MIDQVTRYKAFGVALFRQDHPQGSFRASLVDMLWAKQQQFGSKHPRPASVSGLETQYGRAVSPTCPPGPLDLLIVISYESFGIPSGPLSRKEVSHSRAER